MVVGYFNDIAPRGNVINSFDGINWSIVGSVTSETLFEVQFCIDTWVAVGANGTLLTSKTGDNWEARNSSTNSDLKSIACGNNTVVAVGENGLILQSDQLDLNSVSQQSDGGGGGSCFITALNTFLFF